MTSVTINADNNPRFNSRHVFPLVVDLTLLQRLQTSNLDIYIIDDCDPDTSAFLCYARIPLASLATMAAIDGEFSVQTDSGASCGTVELSISWAQPLPGSQPMVKMAAPANSLALVPFAAAGPLPGALPSPSPGTPKMSRYSQPAILMYCFGNTVSELIISSQLRRWCFLQFHCL